jgi:hypothetical protein
MERMLVVVVRGGSGPQSAWRGQHAAAEVVTIGRRGTPGWVGVWKRRTAMVGGDGGGGDVGAQMDACL